MLLLHVMMIITFKLNKINFVNIKMSLKLLLQGMMVNIFMLIYMTSVSQDVINVTLASDDGRHIQAHIYNFCFSRYY